MSSTHVDFDDDTDDELPESPEPQDVVTGTFARTASPPPSTRKRLAQTDTTETLPPPSFRSTTPRPNSNSPTPTTLSSPALSETEAEEVEQDTSIHRRVGRPEVPQRRRGEVAFTVKGRRFVVDSAIFMSHPDTLLAKIITKREAGEHMEGDIPITHNISAIAFSAILRFYRDGEIRCPPGVSIPELHEACDYFLLPFTSKSIKCEDIGTFLHELSNRGARQRFSEFLDHSLISAMGKCATLGERSCHIVVLSEDDTVEWDEELPPALGEQYAQVVHNTSLYRFLMSYENRSIAKSVMRERGLKRIRLGIEGFPTFVERIRWGGDGTKLEVEYNYDQRPFLKASWEKEEHKNRHVDFQSLRTRSSGAAPSNVLSTVMS